MPPPLQKEVHATVVQTKERSEWPARKTLVALGIARRSYYRWLKEEKWARELPAAPIKPVQAYEALPEEKQATVDYARKHTDGPHHPEVQRGAVAQRPGVSAAGGLLPWRSEAEARSPESEAGASASPPPRAKPKAGPRDLTLRRGRTCHKSVRLICAIVDETNQLRWSILRIEHS